MAKAKSKSIEEKKPEQASAEKDLLLQALPFVRDTRGEPCRGDQGLHWWHVQNTDYWHQDLSIGEAFCEKAAALHVANPEDVQFALRCALGHMVHKGYLGGIEQGFLNRLVHYATVGMTATGVQPRGPMLVTTV